MNTNELMRVMCDGRTSINEIVDLMRATDRTQEQISEGLRYLLDDATLRSEVRNHQVFYVPA